MKSREISTHSDRTTMSPYIAIDECVNYQETSYVCKCMQCDLQLQTDIAAISRHEPQMIDEAVIRTRFDPDSMLQPEE